MIGSYRRMQCGAVLFVTLVLLVAVTLLGMAMSGLSRSNLQIVRNNQSEQLRIAVAQRAVEQVLNDITYFTQPTAPVTLSDTSGMQVAVSDRVCVRSVTAAGYSATSGSMPPIDTVWRFSVTVSDAASGGSSTMSQGASIRMLAGNCV
jgi:Tfp pilus assembly protein PilX